MVRTPHCQAAAAAKSLQSCPTLCDAIDGSPPGSAVPGILQARTLEWVAISFSNAWKWKGKGKPLSRVQLWATLRTAAHQAPPSMGFSKQEYWSGLPLSSPTLPRMWVQSLIGELRSQRFSSVAKKRKDFLLSPWEFSSEGLCPGVRALRKFHIHSFTLSVPWRRLWPHLLCVRVS